MIKLTIVVGLGMMTLARVEAPQAQTATVELIGPGGQQRTVTVSDLRAMPSLEVDVTSHNVKGRYRGALLGALLRSVGMPPADSLRGPALAQDVIVEGSDGYRVVFAPAELDSGYTNEIVLLAYEKDGRSLDAAEGPFRVIAPGEKRPARWVRNVVKVRLRRVVP